MVYLIHLEIKFKHAQHYIGFAYDRNFDKRIKHHKNDTGSAFLRAVNKAGISWVIARTWPDADGDFERKIKNWNKSSQLCPICIANKKKLNEIT